VANAHSPGGGYLSGAGAQEESLFRRTNYHQFVDPKYCDVPDQVMYPLPEYGAIYSNNVLLLRTNEKSGYGLLPEPVPLSFIAVAAYNNPPCQDERLTPEFASKTQEKMRAMFRIALNHQHNCLILGAFGCGAFRNPTRHIAQLFKEVVAQFWNQIQIISFAILEDHNTFQKHNPTGNIAPFAEAFSGTAILI